jgi:uncharacterized membrane protein SpoIIM required for sporulation
MADTRLTLKSHRFRAEREGDWQRLEDILNHLEKGKGRQLSDADIIAIPGLYRGALSSLSVARSISLDSSLLNYLESLCSRAYFFVYGARTPLLDSIGDFFVRGWPRAVRALWRETLVAGALGLLGVFTGYLLTMRSPDWFFSFAGGMAEGRGPGASHAELSQTLYGGGSGNGLTFLASFLFTHNSGIALLAFALGFACGLPTAALMLYNGLMLGAFFAVFVAHGLGIEFGGWVFIHGVTELSAITLAGAAGFRIGWVFAFPGKQARTVALQDAGRQAAIVMAGVVVMLACAGLLEGYGRQLILNTWARYGTAAATALFWGFYFYGRRARPA